MAMDSVKLVDTIPNVRVMRAFMGLNVTSVIIPNTIVDLFKFVLAHLFV
jgi:hypothetical protein